MLKKDLYSLIHGGEIAVNNLSPPLFRFWSHVDKSGPVHPIYGRCWMWTAGKSHNGYGQFTVNYKPIRAHRFSYIQFVGAIPGGLDVLHHCDNPSCVRPTHLFIGTSQENQRDKFLKDRQAKGEGNGWAKLTEEQVNEIRRRYRIRLKNPHYHDSKNGQTALAREFNTTQANISIIVRGEGWKHL